LGGENEIIGKVSNVTNYLVLVYHFCREIKNQKKLKKKKHLRKKARVTLEERHRRQSGRGKERKGNKHLKRTISSNL